MSNSLEVGCTELRWICDPETLGFESTAELEPENGTLGQGEALDALRFGLETFAAGQNVFLRGLTGSGRTALVRRLLEEIQPACPLALDCGYVANFVNPAEPRLIRMARGSGAALRDALDGFVRFLSEELGAALDSEDLRERRQVIDRALEEELRRLSAPFEENLAKNELALVQIQHGKGLRQVVLPLIEGEPTPPEKLRQLLAEGKLTDEAFAEITEKASSGVKKLEGLSTELRAAVRQHAEEVRAFVRTETRLLVESEVERIRVEFPTESVARFLDEVVDDVPKFGVEDWAKNPELLRRYRIGLVGAHRPDEGCPVIIESTPTLSNLLGIIGRRQSPEIGSTSDHLMIQAGSLLRADGGYLVIEAREVLQEPGAWKLLVRSLKAGQLEIVPSELAGVWGAPAIKPERIPIQVKVILIGDPGLYHALDSTDPDFPQLFKVLADFDSEVELSPTTLSQLARVLARVLAEERLPDFHRSAVARLAEHGARIAGRNDRLTTRLGRLMDLGREAAFLAGKAGKAGGPMVMGEHVTEAVRRSKRRADLPARKFRASMVEGTLHIDVQGSVVGQVNGLAVLRAGPLTYGFPCRITATIGAGHAGTINIERESQLSGAIHTKGFYILGGLLRHLLRTHHPLAFSSSIAFEQSYGGIDGDSASGAEICCLLSALTDVPLRQGLAMTGAIDQHGRIQPIGAVTEKIEGFYDACLGLNLTGDQGVIIPRSNLKNLMLRGDVVEACAAGRFHVYAVDRIEQALELFTGMESGVRAADGEYPEGSLLRIAVDRAGELWSLAAGRSSLDSVEEEEEEDAEEDASEAD